MNNKARHRLIFECFSVALFFFFILTLFFPEAFFLGKLVSNGDLAREWHYGLLTFFSHHGLSIWVPSLCMGYPMTICPTSGAFYPFSMLAGWFSLAFPPEVVLSMLIILFHYLEALFMYMYMRSIRCGIIEALFAGTLFGFNEFTMGSIPQIVHNNFMWFPLTLFLAERYFQSRWGGRWVILMGLALGIQCLGGHYQYAFYGMTLFVAYFIFCTLNLKRRGAGLALLVLVFIALGVCAIGLLPVLELLSQSTRSSTDFNAVIELARKSGQGLLTGSILLSLFYYKPEYIWNDDFWSLHLGMLPGLCVFLSFCRVDVRRYVYFYLAVVVLVLAFSLEASPFLSIPYSLNIPGFHMFKNPVRLSLLLVFSVCVLSGLGMGMVDMVFRRKRVALYLKIIIFTISVAHLASRSLLAGHLSGKTFDDYFGNVPVTADEFQRLFPKVPQFVLDESKADLVRYYFSKADARNTTLTNDATESSGFTQLPLQRHMEFTRGSLSQQPLEINSSAFFPSWRRLRLTNTKYVVIYDEPFDKNPLHQATIAPFFTPVFKEGLCTVYLVRDYLPRAFFIPNFLILRDKWSILQKLDDPSFDPLSDVILEEPGAFISTTERGQGLVKVKSYAPHKVDISLESKSPGFLVLLDTYYPGWNVRVDGRPSKLYRADYLFRAVYMPEPGKHTVSFTYQPRFFYLGALITLFTLVACAWAWGRVRKDMA